MAVIRMFEDALDKVPVLLILDQYERACKHPGVDDDPCSAIAIVIDWIARRAGWQPMEDDYENWASWVGQVVNEYQINGIEAALELQGNA